MHLKVSTLIDDVSHTEHNQLVVFCLIIICYAGYNVSNAGIMGIYLVVLIVAGIVNTYTETLLTTLCYISVAWHVIGEYTVLLYVNMYMLVYCC